MRLIFICLICFWCTAADAQQLSEEYISRCNEFFRDIHLRTGCGKIDCTTIVFDTSDESYFKKSTFYKDTGRPCDPKTDSIVFLPMELRYIFDQMHKFGKVEWESGNLLDSINFLPQRYVDSLEAKTKEEDSLYWWRSFYEHFSCHTLYRISHPIFLRNNTVCIFIWANNSSGFMDIYVKRKKGWEQYAELWGYIEG